MSQVYPWLVFLHVLGVFGFLLAHGASAIVTFRVRRERDLARVGALLDLSRSGNVVANICLLVFLLAGIIAGFMGNWWGQGWIWAALGLLIALAVVMFALGSGPLERVRDLLKARERSSEAGDAAEAAAEGATEKQVAALLDATHPVLITVLGGGVLVVILWLMMFKPF